MEKKMKKSFTILSVLVIAVMVLSACGAKATATVAPATSAPATTAPTEAPTTAATEAPTTAATEAPTTAATTAPTGGCPLDVEEGATITFSGWGDETEQKIYRDSITRFQALCPGVTVDYQPIPDKFQDKLKAQMAGGTAPDVFYVDDQLMNAFAPSGQLLALDDYMAKAGVSRDDFIPALLTIFTRDGKTYALPKDWGTLGLVYLPEAFQDAGVDEPTDSWTWNDLRTAAKAISDKGTYKGFCMGADWARFAPFVFSNGGSFASEDNKTATLDSPEVKEMAQLVADMYKEGSLVKPADVGASWCGEAIGKKLVAMTTEGGWMVNFMKQNYADVDWKAVQIPSGSKTRADIIFTNGVGVNAATKYPNAAAAFAIYLTGKENQGEIVKTGFAYSTHPDQADLVQDPNDLAISSGGLLPDTRVAFWGPNTGKVNDAVSQALDRIFLGDQTVDEALAQAQEEVQAALSGQ
jgi:multiple sugar transport system substrate-binding protein